MYAPRFCPKAKVLVTKMQRAKKVKAMEMAAMAIKMAAMAIKMAAKVVMVLVMVVMVATKEQEMEVKEHEMAAKEQEMVAKGLQMVEMELKMVAMELELKMAAKVLELNVAKVPGVIMTARAKELVKSLEHGLEMELEVEPAGSLGQASASSSLGLQQELA